MYRSPSEEKIEELQNRREQRDGRSRRFKVQDASLEIDPELLLNNKVISDMINDIWVAYDRDENGVLDRSEMSKFILEIFEGLEEQAEVTEEKINKVFAEFDINGDGHIQKEEMLAFIKFFTGL